MSWFVAHLIGWTTVRLSNVICPKCEGITKTSSVLAFSKIYNPFKKAFEISHKLFLSLRNNDVFETTWTRAAESLRHLERFMEKCKSWIMEHSEWHCWSFLTPSSETGFLIPHCSPVLFCFLFARLSITYSLFRTKQGSVNTEEI